MDFKNKTNSFHNYVFISFFSLLATFQATKERRAREIEPDENIYNEMTEQEIHQLLTLNDQMQHQILQSRQTGGQENESNGGVQIARGGMQQQENLENIQYTLQPSQHLDFSQEKDDSV